MDFQFWDIIFRWLPALAASVSAFIFWRRWKWEEKIRKEDMEISLHINFLMKENPNGVYSLSQNIRFSVYNVGKMKCPLRIVYLEECRSGERMPPFNLESPILGHGDYCEFRTTFDKIIEFSKKIKHNGRILLAPVVTDYSGKSHRGNGCVFTVDTVNS